ncbi:MAG: hypothetical protein DA408_04675 [Bacteroidetes bacterium]|nr:MAG: hypothetical protein C7N36_06260 [Bacteroidota bacterium]PTM14036.1 MAG: hypothetical protein DA408_04675 [Bacteroidota bacterium]
MGVQITEDVLDSINMTAEELLIEMATHLYDLEKLSMGQARHLANLDHISFQKELAKRNIYIKYNLDEFLEDMKTIEALD